MQLALVYGLYTKGGGEGVRKSACSPQGGLSKLRIYNSSYPRCTVQHK